MESAWEIDRVEQMRRNPEHSAAAAAAAHEKREEVARARAAREAAAGPLTGPQKVKRGLFHGRDIFLKFLKFVGPGILISVAYIDPDNFQENVQAGAQFEYKMLFMLLVANIIAIFLQSMSVKLGSVTGLDLAQMNRANLPRWLNIILWLLAEAAIICTDVGSVVGTAIALNLLQPKIPLAAGCAISMVDTLFILIFYRPWGGLKWVRGFEFFVATIVGGVVILLCIQLSQMDAAEVPAGPVFKGYLPSRTAFVGQGLLSSVGIIGGTIQPHTIYLGSGLVQARMRDYDIQNDNYTATTDDDDHESSWKIYRPSLASIKNCMTYAIAELCTTMFIIAIFVNSAILIVAAASIDDDDAENADLFALYTVFQKDLGNAAAIIYALGLMFSGISTSIVATMAGQMICEGAMNWRISPLLRRFLTRCISIIPAIVIAASVGRDGLGTALYVCNIILSVVLVLITAPLLYYTSRSKFMMVPLDNGKTTQGNPVTALEKRKEEVQEQQANASTGWISMANGWCLIGWCAFIWLFIAVMNVALWVLLGIGSIDDL